MKLLKFFLKKFQKKPYEQTWKRKDALARMEKTFFKGNLFVALFELKIVGLAIILGPKVSKEKRVYLDELWISEKFQGKGIGKDFIKFLELEAKKRGGKIIDIIAHRKANAIKFYDKLKYKQSKDFIFLSKSLQ